MEEGTDLDAKIEAFLRPRIVSEFVSKYDGSQLPREDIAMNVLENFGVPRSRAGDVLSDILDGAGRLGLITEIKGKKYLNLGARADVGQAETREKPIDAEVDVGALGAAIGAIDAVEQNRFADVQASKATEAQRHRARRVFITHGKNKDFIEPIKRLLNFGEMEPVVSVEQQSVSQPVPDKVMGDMRSCGAAIIHVDGELELLDKEANSHVILNPNVLIEIGAAMALYGRRFILLVRNGVKLPSNLQGLYEVRYSGEALDGEATIRLLEAIRQLKEVPLTS